MSRSLSTREHPFAGRWNHNDHYYPRIAELIEGRHLVLDVGCGDGSLARFLATGQVDAPAPQDSIPEDTVPEDSAPEGPTTVPPEINHEVLGIDIDAPALPADSPGTHFVLADAHQLPYPAASFDAVVCVAALHHMNPRLALAEMHRVLRPGGRIVLLGLARQSWRPAGMAADLRDKLLNSWWRLRTTAFEPDTLKTRPELNWPQTRAVVETALPGVDYHRVPLWRWLAVWDEPAHADRNPAAQL